MGHEKAGQGIWQKLLGERRKEKSCSLCPLQLSIRHQFLTRALKGCKRPLASPMQLSKALCGQLTVQQLSDDALAWRQYVVLACPETLLYLAPQLYQMTSR